MRVQDVMTTQVVAVLPGATLKEAARLLAEHRFQGCRSSAPTASFSACSRRPTLLIKEQGQPRRGTRSRRSSIRWTKANRQKLIARLVGEAMTSPALTISTTARLRRRRS